MPSKREILALLPRNDLIDFVENYGLDVPDKRKKDALVEALAHSKKASLVEMLEMLPRDQLKELCRGLGLDDGGREKAVIIERLVGSGHSERQTALFVDDPPEPDEPETAEPRAKRAPRATGAVHGSSSTSAVDGQWFPRIP